MAVWADGRPEGRMIKQAAILAVAVAAAVGAGQLATSVNASQSRAASPASPEPRQGAPATAEAAAMAEPGAASLSKSADGHYWAEAEVDGRWVHFLVDTGASTVALTQADARRLGMATEGLIYDYPVMTANGRTQAAPVVLGHVAVAGARVDGVSALVVKDGLSASLLGMTYLGRLSRFEATPSTLILRP